MTAIHGDGRANEGVPCSDVVPVVNGVRESPEGEDAGAAEAAAEATVLAAVGFFAADAGVPLAPLTFAAAVEVTGQGRKQDRDGVGANKNQQRTNLARSSARVCIGVCVCRHGSAKHHGVKAWQHRMSGA